MNTVQTIHDSVQGDTIRLQHYLLAGFRAVPIRCLPVPGDTTFVPNTGYMMRCDTFAMQSDTIV